MYALHEAHRYTLIGRFETEEEVCAWLRRLFRDCAPRHLRNVIITKYNNDRPQREWSGQDLITFVMEYDTYKGDIVWQRT